MSREAHVRFCEKLGVKFPGLTRRRLRLTDGQRRRLAARAKGLEPQVLAELATIVTPETLFRWTNG